MIKMNDAATIFAIISAIATILSIIFAILAFSRNKTKDNLDLEKRITMLEAHPHGKDDLELESRLTRMEIDLQYIRQSLDDSKKWRHTIENRVQRLELNNHNGGNN